MIAKALYLGEMTGFSLLADISGVWRDDINGIFRVGVGVFVSAGKIKVTAGNGISVVVAVPVGVDVGVAEIPTVAEGV